MRRAAGVLICVNDEVLLCKRVLTYNGVKIPFGGYWSPFAGTSEENENLMMTAIRELREESKIEAKIHELFHLYETQTDKCIFTIYGLCLDKKPYYDVEKDLEHTDSKYFKRKLIETYQKDYKIDQAIIEAVKALNKKLDFIESYS